MAWLSSYRYCGEGDSQGGGVNYIWEIQDSARMTVLNLEQYRSAVELCESLLDNNSIVRPSDTSVLGFPIDFEALARYALA